MDESLRENIVAPKSSEVEVREPKIESNPQARTTSDVEVPYTEYEREHAHPYLVDHFQLGSSWDDPEGGFYEEVNLIENYLHKQIQSGEIANSTESVKNRIKELEKVINLKNEFRAVVKIPILAAHIKFLNETSVIKRNVSRYGQRQSAI